MNRFLYHIFIFIILLFSFTRLQAQIQLSDSAKVNLFTVGPWDGEVYAFYGHSAIQIKDDSTGVDAMFNYGYFDMSKPYFVYHFMRGKTDYVLGTTSYEAFVTEHQAKGLEIVKQELRMMHSEKQSLFNALYINSLPKNRAYRYNFLFDNCATRPRDMIEEYVEGKIEYANDAKKQTFRDLIHECVHAYRWMEFGIDLIIGNPADIAISLREKMFLPAYLMKAMDGAMVIKNDTTSYRLVTNKIVVSEDKNKTKSKREYSVFSPIPMAFVLLLMTIIVSFFQSVKRKNVCARIYDTFLFGVAGTGGLIIMFLLFFSEHPAVAPNWNFIWMNVFALLFACFFWIPSLKRLVKLYHLLNFFVLTLFLALWWLLPQYIPLAAVVFAISLWMRSGTNLLASRMHLSKKRKYTTSRDMKAGWGA